MSIKLQQLLQFLLQWSEFLVNRLLLFQYQWKKHLSALRSNFNKFQFVLSKQKENISIDFWHKQLDQKSLLFLFKVSSHFPFYYPVLYLALIGLLWNELTHPSFVKNDFSPCRTLRLQGTAIRWLWGAVWNGSGISQTFSWVVGPWWLALWLQPWSELTALITYSWILSTVTAWLGACWPGKKPWELKVEFLLFHGGYSTMGTHTCYSFSNLSLGSLLINPFSSLKS